MWSNSEYIWPNAQHNWPNACAFHQMRLHLAIVGKFDQMRWANMQRNWPNARAFDKTLNVKCRAFCQLVRFAAHLAKCADWSNAPNMATDSLDPPGIGF